MKAIARVERWVVQGQTVKPINVLVVGNGLYLRTSADGKKLKLFSEQDVFETKEKAVASLKKRGKPAWVIVSENTGVGPGLEVRSVLCSSYLEQDGDRRIQRALIVGKAVDGEREYLASSYYSTEEEAYAAAVEWAEARVLQEANEVVICRNALDRARADAAKAKRSLAELKRRRKTADQARRGR